jgi:hypothetical protein
MTGSTPAAAAPLSISDLSAEEKSAIYQYYVGAFIALCVILLLVRKVSSKEPSVDDQIATVQTANFARLLSAHSSIAANC